jgi:hypothetical protein
MTAAAEQSLQTAIAIAQSQKARSFELRAALSLAKLYRAANRDADAHAVLAPAVEDFPPTRQFPELTEAQALISVLNPLVSDPNSQPSKINPSPLTPTNEAVSNWQSSPIVASAKAGGSRTSD